MDRIASFIGDMNCDVAYEGIIMGARQELVSKGAFKKLSAVRKVYDEAKTAVRDKNWSVARTKVEACKEAAQEVMAICDSCNDGDTLGKLLGFFARIALGAAVICGVSMLVGPEGTTAATAFTKENLLASAKNPAVIVASYALGTSKRRLVANCKRYIDGCDNMLKKIDAHTATMADFTEPISD